MLIKVLFNSCNHYCFCRFDFLPLLRVYSVVFHFCTEEAETKKPEGSRQVMCFASLHSHPIANPSNISQTPPKNTRGEASEKTSSRDTSQREKSFVGLTWLCCDLLVSLTFCCLHFDLEIPCEIHPPAGSSTRRGASAMYGERCPRGASNVNLEVLNDLDIPLKCAVCT